MTDRLEHQLREVAGRLPALRLAYLFGSRAKGQPREDSDLDIAVLWAEGLSPRDRDAAEEALRAALANELGALGERVDLLDLARAGSTIAFRVIRDGTLVFAVSPHARVNFEARTARRYDDEAPYRALFRAAARRAGARMGADADGRR